MLSSVQTDEALLANNPNIVWCYILCSFARNAAHCCVSWK